MADDELRLTFPPRWSRPHFKGKVVAPPAQTKFAKRKPPGVTARARKAKAVRRSKVYVASCALVDVRDGRRCRGCEARRDLHHHHVRPRALGVDDSPNNLILVCARCHALIHAKQLVIAV